GGVAGGAPGGAVARGGGHRGAAADAFRGARGGGGARASRGRGRVARGGGGHGAGGRGGGGGGGAARGGGGSRGGGAGGGGRGGGMGQALYASDAVFRAALDEVCGAVDGHLGRPLREVMFHDAAVHETRYAQPALFALEVALYRRWAAWGLRVDRLLGHSVGE